MVLKVLVALFLKSVYTLFNAYYDVIDASTAVRFLAFSLAFSDPATEPENSYQ